MKSTSTLLATLVMGIAVACILAPSSFACTPPPVEGIVKSWAPLQRVLVTFDSNLNLIFGGAPPPVTTAVNNWNASTVLMCNAPVLVFSVGSGKTMSIAYAPLAPDPITGQAKRGETFLFFTSRINSAVSTINSLIPLSFPIVLEQIIAHEIGHTMGLNDCMGCTVGSSVMVSGVVGLTGSQGTSGPTQCDLVQVAVNAPDYPCRPTAPGCELDCPYPPGTCIPCGGSPIILDLNGEGFHLTNAQNGVLFDISGTDNPAQMGWTAQGADNGFLALPGSDGLVHNGRQLFGNFTPQPPSPTPNGFAALAVYDDPKNGGNGDGIIDAQDAIFASLRIWIDTNHDGISQPSELHTLASLDVKSINLNYRESARRDEYGNFFRYRALVSEDASSDLARTAYDVFFVTAVPPTACLQRLERKRQQLNYR
jgi:hypothetical protein